MHQHLGKQLNLFLEAPMINVFKYLSDSVFLFCNLLFWENWRIICISVFGQKMEVDNSLTSRYTGYSEKQVADLLLEYFY